MVKLNSLFDIEVVWKVGIVLQQGLLLQVVLDRYLVCVLDKVVDSKVKQLIQVCQVIVCIGDMVSFVVNQVQDVNLFVVLVFNQLFDLVGCIYVVVCNSQWVVEKLEFSYFDFMLVLVGVGQFKVLVDCIGVLMCVQVGLDDGLVMVFQIVVVVYGKVNNGFQGVLFKVVFNVGQGVDGIKLDLVFL